MGFQVTEVLVVKEVNGAIPSNPTCIKFKSEGFSFAEEQASEIIKLIGEGGDSSPEAYGQSSFSGAVPLVLGSDNVLVVAHHTIGTPTSIVDASATAWLASTAHAVVGEIVNHSDGIHSLVVYTAGTTDLTEPVLTTANRGDKITDGTVVWIVMPLLKKYTYARQQTADSFAVELTLFDGTSYFYQRFTGVYMNSLPLSASGSDVSLKLAMDFAGSNMTDSTTALRKTGVAFVPLKDQAGFSRVIMADDFYGSSEVIAKIDSVQLAQTEMVEQNFNRAVTITPLLHDEKRADFGVTEITGTIKQTFTEGAYDDADDHTEKSVEFGMYKTNGCEAVFTYPQVRSPKTAPVVSTEMTTILELKTNAHGIDGSPSISAVIISPILRDSTGTIVGAGTY